jgi:hypothetical protein
MLGCMDLGKAIHAHSEWKTKLRSAIAQLSSLDTASITAENQCPLGKWVHGEARSKYGQLATYRECVGAHADFHRQVGAVARQINSKQFAAAEAAPGASTPYADASSKTGVAIIKLRKKAGL